MRILFAGDFCPNYRIKDSLSSNQESILADLKHIISNSDFSFINLECPVINEACHPIIKNGPHLSTSYHAIKFLKDTGFNAVTLANNHIKDYGNEGINETIKQLELYGIKYVGAGENISQAAKPLFIRVNNEVLAVINCCEHEFSISTEQEAGAHPLNPIKQWYQIKEIRECSDYLVVIVHGGDEYHQLPSPRMQEIYRYFIDAGADAVINHHQHCFSGYEYYKGKPIVYGLGNFLFDSLNKRKTIWNEGYCVIIDTEKKEDSIELIPYTQCNENPRIELLENRDSFDHKIQRFNSVILDKNALNKEYQNWIINNTRVYEDAFQPYTNKYMKALFHKGLLPSFLNKARILKLLNYIECESHRDRTIFILHNLLNKYHKQ